MDEPVVKYLKRLKAYFVTFGILAFIYMLTIGWIFIVMGGGKIISLILSMLIPIAFISIGVLIRKKSPTIWIMAVILAAILLVSSAYGIFSHIPASIYTSLVMFPFNPTIIGFIFEIFMIAHLLKIEIRKYYF